jgi:DNA-binding transcriptional ArsR family regulator
MVRSERVTTLRIGAKHRVRKLRHTGGMNTNQVARIAGLVGEPARTGMLLALMDGRALTAGELASAGHISAATASRHLALLVEGGLLRVERQGKHRYHRLASAEVARVLEGIMQLAAASVPSPRKVVTGPRDAQMRLARTCYDHLAGRVGVAIADATTERELIDWEHGLRLTPEGEQWLTDLAIDVPRTAKRPALRPCLDWTERRPHLAGAVGAALCGHALEQGWIKRVGTTRAVLVTPAGRDVLRERLGLSEQALTPAGR